MAVRTRVTFGAQVAEQLALGSNITGANTGRVLWNQLYTTISLSDGSTPDIDDAWLNRVALSAGTVTLALDALPATGMTAKDWSGKRVIFFAMHNRGANTMLIAGAAANPYELFGGATDQMTVPAGGYVQAFSPTGFGVVSGTVSDITVTGTLTQQFDILLVAGTP